MSLRYVSRVLYQSGMRMFFQGMKDQGQKCDHHSKLQARRFSTTFDSAAAFKAVNSDKLKRAEESLRIVMYLSCWGPN